jgi:hypothetical protein
MIDNDEIFTLCSFVLLNNNSFSYAALQEVMKEATGSGPTQQQAIAEALLIAAQSVNGPVSLHVQILAEEVNMVVTTIIGATKEKPLLFLVLKHKVLMQLIVFRC